MPGEILEMAKISLVNARGPSITISRLIIECQFPLTAKKDRKKHIY